MNKSPLVSVIVPAWNGRAYFEACLNSLLAQDYPNFEVIVVDNASTDGTPEWVAKHFPAVTLIRNDCNLGFAGGVNIGLRAAKGEILSLFNQDAVAKPDWLAALVLGLLTAPDIGVAGCKVLNSNEHIIQHAGGYLTLPHAQPGHLGFGQADEGQYEQLRDVDYVTGAALALRREVLEAVGYFDETFFFYYEDVDYCYRARAAGFRVVYIPQAVLYHHGASSLGRGTVSHHANLNTSRLQFVLKHWGPAYFVSQFQPAESTWFKHTTSAEERLGLRQAYQTMISKIATQNGLELALTKDSRADLLATLHHLRQQVYAAYLDSAWQALEVPSKTSEPISEPWWQVKEGPFVSRLPLVGPLVAWFRTLWNDVSTKWFVRFILQQQNEVNRIMVQRLEMQGQLLYNQGRIWQDFDREQTQLATQLGEIIQRLDKIETRLSVLEQKQR